MDGQVVCRAIGEAILGNPLWALQLLAAHLAKRGKSLPAGSLVLAGALPDAVPLAAGHHYWQALESLGEVSLTIG